MSHLFQEHFDTAWRTIFAVLFVGIMLPIRCFVNYEYAPSWLGVPNFVWNWLIYGVIAVVLIVVYYRMAMKRSDFHEFDEKEGE
jgi:TctA family transporter